MIGKVKGELIEYGGMIDLKSTVKFSFRDRVKILFGETVRFYAHIYTKEEVNVITQDARAGVGPEPNKATLRKMFAIIFCILLLSCSKKDVPANPGCASVTIYFDQLDVKGNVDSTWIGWTDPKVCGEDLQRFREMEPQYVCTPQLYRRIVIQ